VDDPQVPGADSPSRDSSHSTPPSVPPTSAGPIPFLPPPPVPAEVAPKPKWVIGALAIVLGLFLAYLRAWSWSYGMMTTQAWGYAWGSALLPALIAYAIAGRKSVRNFNRAGMWFCGLMLVFVLVSFAGKQPRSMDQHIADLMKEAAGTKPVDNSGPDDIDRTIRAIMQDILSMRKALEDESAPYNAELATVYSASSFADRAAMQKMIDAVHGAVKADGHFNDQLEHWPERVQGILDKSNLSASDKEGILGGFRSAFQQSPLLDVRRKVVAAEGLWETETVGLYQFALSKADRIQVIDKQIVVSGAQNLREFNDRMQRAANARIELNKMNKELEKIQQPAIQQYGLTKKDLGLEKQ